MLQSGDQSGLVQESSEKPWAGRSPLGEDLEDHAAPHAQILGPVDLPQPAASQLLENAVAVDAATRAHDDLLRRLVQALALQGSAGVLATDTRLVTGDECEVLVEGPHTTRSGVRHVEVQKARKRGPGPAGPAAVRARRFCQIARRLRD